VILAATAGHASADNRPGLARQLFELGVEEYKAKQYDAASASMGKSYALDPQPQALYALAQAERLNGNCKDAVPHYEKMLETTKDESTIKAVKNSIELCHQIESGKPQIPDPKVDATEAARRDAPILQIRTVYRTEKKSDVASIVMFAGGGIALSGGVALYVMSRSTRSDADHAQSLTEYNDLYDRADRLRWMSYASAGLGLGLVTIATIRVLGHGSSKTESPSVAIAPLRGGGSMVSWSSRW